jgi:anti-sigma-K factor RskA
MRYSHPVLLEHLASSYVLGTLTGGARRRFERLQRDRADVRVLVAQWETRLGLLAVSVPAQQPSPQLWKGIAARTRPVHTPIARPAASWPGWLKPAGFGFGGLVAGVIAAGVLIVMSPGLLLSSDQVAMRTGEKLPQSYVGLLTDAQGNGKLLVSSLRYGKTMTVKVIGPIVPPASGQLVLWAVPADGQAFSLGPVPATGSRAYLLPDTSEKLLSKVSKLMVTLESEAAPGAPGSTVVFSGNCARLW